MKNVCLEKIRAHRTDWWSRSLFKQKLTLTVAELDDNHF
jgi:hypothetical protein